MEASCCRSLTLVHGESDSGVTSAIRGPTSAGRVSQEGRGAGEQMWQEAAGANEEEDLSPQRISIGAEASGLM